MKARIILVCIALAFCFTAFSQDEKKMNKHLTVFVSVKLDSKAPIKFDRLNPDKHGWDKVVQSFTSTFLANGFNVVDTKTSSKDSGYSLIMDYDYGYVIALYRMQYSNLKGKIVDLSNNSVVVGTFAYDGKYELENVSNAIAAKTKTYVVVSSPDLQKKDPKNNPVQKSKEEKLRELKDLFDKNLITKEEYEREKKRVLEEQ